MCLKFTSVKNGKFRGKQGYRCRSCGKQFVSKPRKVSTANHLLNRYIWKRQTINQLAYTYGKSEKWVRNTLKLAQPKLVKQEAYSAVIIPDVTFFGRDYGILLCRDPHRKNNPHFQEVHRETNEEYKQARSALEAKGITILAVVIDGRKGVKELFSDVPIQICQFHQIKTVNRYLTRKPKLQAAQELRLIALGLTEMNEIYFTGLLQCWHEKWGEFLKERTINPIDPKKWNYTHKRVRAAYYSLKRNAPYLFTYQKYPELKLPNTTNSADGYFNRLKSLLNVHRGMSKRKRYLLIREILAKSSLHIYH